MSRVEKIRRPRRGFDDDVAEANPELDYAVASRLQERRRDQLRREESHKCGFGCSHCKTFIPIHDHIGTSNRNHCPHCLWSKHMDGDVLGDRKSECQSGMEPIGLAFKKEGSQKLGELMLIHLCRGEETCSEPGGQIRINRIAADDDTDKILGVYHLGQEFGPGISERIALSGIIVATLDYEEEVNKQLFGATPR